MQTLCTQDVAKFDAEFCSFRHFRYNPKPLQRSLPSGILTNRHSPYDLVSAIPLLTLMRSYQTISVCSK